MSDMKTFAEHSHIGNDKVFFVLCANGDVQELADEMIGRKLTETEMESLYNLFNDDHSWRDELRSMIVEIANRVEVK